MTVAAIRPMVTMVTMGRDRVTECRPDERRPVATATVGELSVFWPSWIRAGWKAEE
jgi:hypothetical protein